MLAGATHAGASHVPRVPSRDLADASADLHRRAVRRARGMAALQSTHPGWQQLSTNRGLAGGRRAAAQASSPKGRRWRWLCRHLAMALTSRTPGICMAAQLHLRERFQQGRRSCVFTALIDSNPRRQLRQLAAHAGHRGQGSPGLPVRFNFPPLQVLNGWEGCGQLVRACAAARRGSLFRRPQTPGR